MRVAKRREPRWITLREVIPAGEGREAEPACRVLVRPYSSYGKGSAQAFVRALRTEDMNPGEIAVAFSIGLACWAITDWEGVGDEDGAPLPVTLDNIQALMEDFEVAYEAFDAQYTMPALLEDQEKNGSSPLLVGTSPAGAQMPKRARRKSRGAGKITAPAAATPASTAPTN